MDKQKKILKMFKENKKGIVPLIPATGFFILIVVLGLAIGISFLFSSSMRWVIIGIGVLIAAVYLTGNVLKSDAVSGRKVLILLVFLAVGIFFILGAGVLQNVLAETVWKQNWGHICCVQEYDYDIRYEKWLDQQTLFKCDPYTNECAFEVENTRGTGLFAITFCYSDCDLNGDNCKARTCEGWSAWQSGPVYTRTIDYGRSLKFDSISHFQHIKVSMKAKTFYIKGMEDGKVYRQASCILNSELRNRVLSDGLNELTKTGVNSCQNYMIGWYLAATETYLYNNQKVICQARVLYSIDNKQFMDGSTRKIQGDILTGVECCPQEANCDSKTFKFVEEKVRECTYSSQCPNGGQPIAVTGTSYIVFNCLNGQCVESSPINTECTNNAICVSKYGTGYVCDLSTVNFGKCIPGGSPLGWCGDGICESLLGETEESCPEDCLDPDKRIDQCQLDSDCAWYERCVSKTEKRYKWWNFIGIGKPETLIYNKCVLSSWVYLASGVLVILILGLSFILTGKKKIRRK